MSLQPIWVVCIQDQSQHNDWQDADKSQACVLPANVLQLDEHNNYFVWLKGADGKASKRVVACDKFTATGVTVVNGLNEGDEVIVEGQQKVCEGTPLAL